MAKPCDNCMESGGEVSVSVPCPSCKRGKIAPKGAYAVTFELLEVARWLASWTVRMGRHGAGTEATIMGEKARRLVRMANR